MKANGKQTVNRTVSRPFKQSEPESERDTKDGPSQPLHSVIARSSHTDVERVSRRIAANQLDRLDELSLIGYPGLDPATREVYEVALRLAARGVLES